MKLSSLSTRLHGATSQKTLLRENLIFKELQLSLYLGSTLRWCIGDVRVSSTSSLPQQWLALQPGHLISGTHCTDCLEGPRATLDMIAKTNIPASPGTRVSFLASSQLCYRTSYRKVSRHSLEKSMATYMGE
jgi:hypothetical protein